MKTKRYWLRGGLFLGTIMAISYLVVYNLPNFINFGTSSIFGMFAVVIVGVPLSFLNALPLSFGSSSAYTFLVNSGFFFVLPIFVSFIIYFITGSVIGWIYGKIKNRNKTPQI